MRFLRGILFLAFCGVSMATNAQGKFLISGSVHGNEQPIAFSSVVLLHAADSTIIAFEMTNDKGLFRMDKQFSNDYILQVSSMGYETKYIPFTLKTDLNLGVIALDESQIKLDEAVIKSEVIPIAIKEDTIEFNSAAFKTVPNASVEDLLKKLPGVEVSKDGTVTAQGEQVQKVLVDGKEFFGDDPKLATKNLPADAIDAVQVFDKTSDMADFTGIDDGERTKTINLKLKEGKKNGYFGNATAGYGVPDHRFEGKVSINQFSKKKQLSILGLTNNINDEGFSLQEYASFMGGFRNLFQSGLASFGTNGPTINNGTNTSGINTNMATGLNFNYDFSKKTKLTSSYFFNYIDNQLDNFTNRIYFPTATRPETIASTESEESSQNFNNKLNYRLEHTISQLQDVQVKGNLSINNGDITASSLQTNGIRNELPSAFSEINNDGNGKGISNSTTLLYRRKLTKPGRNFVSEVTYDYSLDDRKIELLSNSNIDSANFITNQQQTSLNSSNRLQGKLSYTEPLGKKRYVEISTLASTRQTNSEKNFFDWNADRRIFDINTALSGYLNSSFTTVQPKISFKQNRAQYNFTAGVGYQQYMLNASTENLSINGSKGHFLPSANFIYRIKQGKQLSLNYRSFVTLPTATQLQPMVDNANPFFITMGNPGLTGEYVHNVRIRYFTFNQFSFTNFFLMANATYTKNKISESLTIDPSLRQIIQPINVDNDVNIRGNANFGTPIRALGIKTNISVSNTFNRGITFINDIENTTNRLIQTADVNIENRKKETIDAKVGTKWAQNTTRYDASDAQNQSFLTTTYYSDLALTVTPDLYFTTSFDYQVYSGASFSTNQSVPLWEASIAYLIFKNKKGQLKLKVFDILNQNTGLIRTSNFNFIEEGVNNALGRYGMLSFTYNLAGFDKKRNASIRMMGGGRGR